MARSLSILGDVCAHWNIYGGFAYVMELIWMSRCFHSSLHSLHLVSPSSKEIAFTKSKDCLWVPVSLQPDGPGAGLSALFLFAKRLYFSCLFMSLLGMRKKVGNICAICRPFLVFLRFYIYLAFSFENCIAIPCRKISMEFRFGMLCTV